MAPIRIVLADDHRIVRQGLRSLLETESDFEVVGEGGDGFEAVRICRALRPTVVLMDLRMPGLDGITALEELRREAFAPAVIILTTFNEDQLLMRGLRAGALAYLLKDTDRETLFAAIRAAARGETLLRADILSSLVASESPVPGALTTRELDILNAVARGERSKEIAAALGTSERTVKAHLSSVYAKLGVDSRAGAVAVAAAKGLIRDRRL